MFSRYGVYPAAGMFSLGHLLLVIFTFLTVGVAYYFTRNYSKEKMYRVIRVMSLVILFLELCKIAFQLTYVPVWEVKEWVPLYYCCMLTYALLFASFGKGNLRRCGEVFLMTGAIVGGLGAIFFPTTCLPSYPAWHYLSIYSFFYHGVMVYFTLILNHLHYVSLKKSDSYLFGSLVFVVCVLSYVMNSIFDSNLMFISMDFPGTPLSILFKLLGPFYTIVMVLGQMTLPFWIPYGVIQLISRKK